MLNCLLVFFVGQSIDSCVIKLSVGVNIVIQKIHFCCFHYDISTKIKYKFHTIASVNRVLGTTDGVTISIVNEMDHIVTLLRHDIFYFVVHVCNHAYIILSCRLPCQLRP